MPVIVNENDIHIKTPQHDIELEFNPHDKTFHLWVQARGADSYHYASLTRAEGTMLGEFIESKIYPDADDWPDEEE